MIPQSDKVLIEETNISNPWLAEELEEKINATFYVATELKQVMHIFITTNMNINM